MRGMFLSFNDHYVNIAENSCKIKLQSFASLGSVTDNLNEIMQYKF